MSLRELVVLPVTRSVRACLVGQKASAATPRGGEMQARQRLRDGSGDIPSCSVREHLMTGERRRETVPKILVERPAASLYQLYPSIVTSPVHHLSPNK
jgi:hypothetical protein